MIKIGITGQRGFIGTHLYNSLGLYPERFRRIPFEDQYFEDTHTLERFVAQCDVIVHLAAVNRHSDPKVIYETNMRLVKQVIDACESTQSTPHILFSSSTQEERDNPYGQSKKEGRKLFERWADKNHAVFSGLIIPNVYGPFGHPYYNSVVATFSHQLTHNEMPEIEIDGQLKLIYVGELAAQIIDWVESTSKGHKNEALIQQLMPPHTAELSVSQLLERLEGYKTGYFNNGEIPALDTAFNRNLFNTFFCYIDHANFFPFNLKLHTDKRGSFVETVKVNSGGQISFSTTLPGIVRGNHFHTRKAERFAVIKGRARIAMRRIGTDKILSFNLDGSRPSFVDMPIWFTHNITNVGNESLYTIFWISEHFSPTDPDTFFQNV